MNYTWAELDACKLCESAGIFSRTNQKNNIKESVEYILLLAEKIKNQRIDLIMQQGQDESS